MDNKQALTYQLANHMLDLLRGLEDREAQQQAMAEMVRLLEEAGLEDRPDKRSPEKFAQSLFLECAVGSDLVKVALEKQLDPKGWEAPTDMLQSLLPSELHPT